MKWVFRYLWEMLRWSFSRWRIHQAIVAIFAGVLFLVGNFAGINWLNTAPAIAAYLAVWLAILTFVIAPACLWHQQDERLRPAISFIDHEDNNAVDVNLHQARVTIINPSAVPLTDVKVLLVSINPRPPRIVTLNVPLRLMHQGDKTSCSLQPGMYRSFDLLWFYEGRRNAIIRHSVETVRRELPEGGYRFKLIAYANETPPITHWFNVEFHPSNSQILQITRED